MQEEVDNTFRVVCLGGSAGGLEAYIDILRRLPNDTGMSFVIVAHRPLTHPEMLPELLARVTNMPIEQVVQGMRLEPNRVFLAPPQMDMTVNGLVLDLKPTSKPKGWPNALTLFLSSLAKAKGARVVAVILSGMDGDGSAALAAIKSEGGMTFAQLHAAYDSMPVSAEETGHVDYILSSADIAKALLEIAKGDASL